MGLKNKIKGKIDDSLGNETIGIIEDFEDDNFANNEDINQQFANYESDHLNSPVLQFLGIQPTLDLQGLMTAVDIENTEFTLTAPTGLDPDEVAEFCNLMQSHISKYRDIVLYRQEDFEKLLKEINRLQQQLIEKQQESELASFIVGQKTVEEELKEEVFNLQLENQRLKSELKKVKQPTTADFTSTSLPVKGVVNKIPKKEEIKDKSKIIPISQDKIDAEMDGLLSMDIQNKSVESEDSLDELLAME